MTSTWTWS